MVSKIRHDTKLYTCKTKYTCFATWGRHTGLTCDLVQHASHFEKSNVAVRAASVSISILNTLKNVIPFCFQMHVYSGNESDKYFKVAASSKFRNHVSHNHSHAFWNTLRNWAPLYPKMFQSYSDIFLWFFTVLRQHINVSTISPLPIWGL